jgi:hypothetical protein
MVTQTPEGRPGEASVVRRRVLAVCRTSTIDRETVQPTV